MSVGWLNTKQLTVLWFTAIAVALILSLAPGGDEVHRPYFILASIIVISATLIYTLRPHRNAKIRLLWLTVGVPVVLLVIAGFAINYFSQLPRTRPTPSTPSTRSVRASSSKFRQIDLSLVEPYNFTMNDTGDVEGWIRNKSSVPIDSVDMHVEIKNFVGDTVGSETQTVSTQIPPSQARHISFAVSSSPKQNGLFGGSSRSPAMVNGTKELDLDEYLAKHRGNRSNAARPPKPATQAMVNEENPFAEKPFDPEEFMANTPKSFQKPQWSWTMKIEAAGTNQR